MSKIYFFLMLCLCVYIAFVCGKQTANAKFQAQIVQETKLQTKQTLQTNRILNEKVYKTGVADIRSILRDEYSIAQ